jgi:hypothetical protein
MRNNLSEYAPHSTGRASIHALAYIEDIHETLIRWGSVKIEKKPLNLANAMHQYY